MDQQLSVKLEDVVRKLGLDKNFNVREDGREQISLAVIDLNGDRPRLRSVIECRVNLAYLKNSILFLC